MRLLLIGGSVFLGRALADAAMARGHEVSILNRGKSSATVPEGVEHLKADRDESLAILRGRAWDAVIDTCAYFPRQVRELLEALEDSIHYTFISSVSAHADLSQSGLDEESSLFEPMGDEVTEVTKDTYGPLKSACEQVVDQSGMAALIIRPGVIAGPNDPTGRFGYWVRRMAATGRFVAPGDGGAPLQIIDVRDLAEWIVRLVEGQATGFFNAVGPCRPITFRDFIKTGVKELGDRAQPCWILDETLASHGIEGWENLPLWLPPARGKAPRLFEINGQKAWEAGLVNRPLADTIRDVSEYESSLHEPVSIGMTREEEAKVLEA
tara:strand:+ start:2507 stop:3478 length:972 start_codon:yes stop_codon:yes gene_type:complete